MHETDKYLFIHYNTNTRRYRIYSYPDNQTLSRPFTSRLAAERRAAWLVERAGWRWEGQATPEDHARWRAEGKE